MAKITGEMDVAFLSTYPPRECGLATFAEDLVNGVGISGMVRPCIIAVTAGMEDYEDPRVIDFTNMNARAIGGQHAGQIAMPIGLCGWLWTGCCVDSVSLRTGNAGRRKGNAR
jgi:hypothetical protein